MLDKDFTLPRILAHRGLHAQAPENTLSAFAAAQNAGVKWLEFDVMLSLDHVPIIFHDDELDRVSNGVGLIADQTFQALQELVVYNRALDGATDVIPSLVQVLHYIGTTQLSVNLEIKANRWGDTLTCQQVLAALGASLDFAILVAEGRLLVSSFSREVVEFFVHHAPHIPRAYLIDSFETDALGFAQAQACVSVNFWAQMPQAEQFLAAARASGMPTLCFTVDAEEEAAYWFQQGVQGIFTNNAACYALATILPTSLNNEDSA